MPSNVSVENNFIGGLKTEFTGLNFPENACTSASNCVFSLIGDVFRREGINFENNHVYNALLTSMTAALGDVYAISTFRWLNAGGDGQSQILVLQVGGILYFFFSSNSTAALPLSAQLMSATINLSPYNVDGTLTFHQKECQFAAGNGYLFVFHPTCDPIYISYSISSGIPAITATRITIQTRDFLGVFPEPGNPAVTFRPTTLTNEHSYNLQNQGWTSAPQWSTSSTTDVQNCTSTSLSILTGPQIFTVQSGLTVTLGTAVSINWSIPYTYQSPGNGNYNAVANGTAVGNVTAYTGTQMSINITQASVDNISPGTLVNNGPSTETIASSILTNTINTWNTQVGGYPSNTDIWFEFKDAGTAAGENGVPTFKPSATISQVAIGVGQAPQGHFLLNEFNQDRSGTSGIPGISILTTTARPKTGCWFQGRVWFSGVDGSETASGDMPFYTWTERVYFSQIATSNIGFGNCYQVNDPTDENLNSLLPTDGGVIYIQGSGSIYKLFPIQNGILVFASNGVWLITGDSGLGFTADDYTVTKLSAVQSISGTSFIDVLGYPFFWNEEGIYRVAPSTAGASPYKTYGFEVEPITVGTILTFYNNIPKDSKRFARGDYDPISYVLSWVYRSTQETDISVRYQYDSSINLNIHNRAFYPYKFGNNGSCFVCGLVYMNYPSGTLPPQFKYLTMVNPFWMTFSEENDFTSWLDFFTFDNTGVDSPATFTCGYKVHGLGFRLFQPIYVNVFANATVNQQYTINGVWDFSTTNLGRQSTAELVTIPNTVTFQSGLVQAPTTGFGFFNNRYKVRGHGRAFQFTIDSAVGQPFHLIGWSIPEQINVGS